MGLKYILLTKCSPLTLLLEWMSFSSHTVKHLLLVGILFGAIWWYKQKSPKYET